MDSGVRDFLTGPSQGFQYDIKKRGASVVFRCRGAFSLASHSAMEGIAEEVKEAPGRGVILDFREVSHIDSAGLGTLATIFQQLRHSGKSLVIVPSAQVRAILTTVNLHKVFPLADNLNAAREAVVRPVPSATEG